MYGKTVYNGQEIAACCTRPDYAKAFIMNRFFPAVICKNCGAVTGVIGAAKELIFKLFFAPFWKGQVFIDNSEITEADLMRIKEFQ
jgi:hypothetical protein